MLYKLLFLVLLGNPMTSVIYPRQPLPSFSAQMIFNQEITHVSFPNNSNKYSVFVFYPFDFTFVCPTELISFSDNIDRFNKLNVQVFGVSTDSIYSHEQWLQQERN